MTRNLKRISWSVLGLLAATFGIGAAWQLGWINVYLAQQQVQQALLDPDSARFSRVKYYRTTGATCGYVNSRNRMGGYAGSVKFMLSPGGIVTFGPSEPDAVNLKASLAEIDAALQQIEANIAFLKKAVVLCPDDATEQSAD